MARTRILDAAQRVASACGAGHLTLEAVASAAGVSKGGLLYHFPTKEALIAAIAEDYVASLGGLIARALSEVSTGSEIAGRIEAHIAGLLMGEGRCRTRTLGAALIVAAANDPSSLAVIRQTLAEQTHWLEGAKADFAHAAVILLAIDGLLFREALHISPFTEAERALVIAELLARAQNLQALSVSTG